MQTVELSGIVTALSSIHHSGGQHLGITSLLRREKFVQPDGSVEEVPVVSGNSLRGILRDRGMWHMCRALGYGEPNGGGAPKGLSLPAFYFLFSGGTLTSTASNGLDIQRARELRELIPLVSIFGGAVGNQIMNGKLDCGKLLPLCSELRHLLPESVQPQCAHSVWGRLQQEMYTRRDDERNEHLRMMIEAPPRQLLAAGFAPAGSSAARDTGEHQQMMYYTETLAAGTQFYWRLILRDVTDIELEAFLTTLVEFSRRPFIGGKSAVGLGEIAVNVSQWRRIDSRVAPTGEDVSFMLGQLYQQHLAERGDAIRATLGAMQ